MKHNGNRVNGVVHDGEWVGVHCIRNHSLISCQSLVQARIIRQYLLPNLTRSTEATLGISAFGRHRKNKPQHDTEKGLRASIKKTWDGAVQAECKTGSSSFFHNKSFLDAYTDAFGCFALLLDGEFRVCLPFFEEHS